MVDGFTEIVLGEDKDVRAAEGIEWEEREDDDDEGDSGEVPRFWPHTSAAGGG